MDDIESLWSAVAVAEEEQQDPGRRPRCTGCRRPVSICLCGHLPSAPVHTAGSLVVLQHPHEARRALGTGWQGLISYACLLKCTKVKMYHVPFTFAAFIHDLTCDTCHQLAPASVEACQQSARLPGVSTQMLRDKGVPAETRNGEMARPWVVAAAAVHTAVRGVHGAVPVSGRGLHSSTFRLNLSAFCAIGGAFRGSLVGGYRVLAGCKGVSRVQFVSETAKVEPRSGRV